MNSERKRALPPNLVDEVRLFVAEEIGERPDRVELTSRLEEDLGVTGDDAEELLTAFSKRFSVKMEG